MYQLDVWLIIRSRLIICLLPKLHFFTWNEWHSWNPALRISLLVLKMPALGFSPLVGRRVSRRPLKHTPASLSFLIERMRQRMVSSSHNCPWLTEEPKHSPERSFCGKWHETMWVCGQPFFDGTNRSMEWGRGREKMLRGEKVNCTNEFEPLNWQSLTARLSLFHVPKEAHSSLVICRFSSPTPPFFSHIANQLFPANVPGVECGVEYLQCWALVWEQASCLCSAYSLQPKTEEERAKQQPQVWPVCRMPGLLSGWQPPTHQGYTAVIRWEEMLEIPNSTDRAHVTWNEEGKSLPPVCMRNAGAGWWW